ncbi:MAG: hypothetical protein HY513_01690 [Candidatus Aenigmarchaeota archaeon]|nr:hypothetical protein [Candidatus Aenigmarchaeota archaeon]
MYEFDSAPPESTNNEITAGLIKQLRKANASRYGLKERMPRTYLLEDTTLQRRKLCLGYNTSHARPDNTVLFTGQCIVKSEEDTECPVTLEDAIECETLREILNKTKVPVICMYPDSTYESFAEAWSGKKVDRRTIDVAAEKYMAFRRNVLPDVTHVRTSEVDDEVRKHIGQLDLKRLTGRIRRVYGGMVLRENEAHALQNTVLEYGFYAALLPDIMSFNGEHVVTFAEPDEICSVKAAGIAGSELYSIRKFSLIGQIALPSLDYFCGHGRIRMYSTARDQRIHLNETDTAIRAKLEKDTDFLLVALYMSPLTSEDELAQIGKSMDRKAGIDVMVEQVRKFRTYLG